MESSKLDSIYELFKEESKQKLVYFLKRNVKWIKNLLIMRKISEQNVDILAHNCKLFEFQEGQPLFLNKKFSLKFQNCVIVQGSIEATHKSFTKRIEKNQIFSLQKDFQYTVESDKCSIICFNIICTGIFKAIQEQKQQFLYFVIQKNFPNLKKKSMKFLVENIEDEFFSFKEEIYQENQQSDRFYIIKKGNVELVKSFIVNNDIHTYNNRFRRRSSLKTQYLTITSKGKGQIFGMENYGQNFRICKSYANFNPVCQLYSFSDNLLKFVMKEYQDEFLEEGLETLGKMQGSFVRERVDKLKVFSKEQNLLFNQRRNSVKAELSQNTSEYLIQQQIQQVDHYQIKKQLSMQNFSEISETDMHEERNESTEKNMDLFSEKVSDSSQQKVILKQQQQKNDVIDEEKNVSSSSIAKGQGGRKYIRQSSFGQQQQEQQKPVSQKRISLKKQESFNQKEVEQEYQLKKQYSNGKNREQQLNNINKLKKQSVMIAQQGQISEFEQGNYLNLMYNQDDVLPSSQNQVRKKCNTETMESKGYVRVKNRGQKINENRDGFDLQWEKYENFIKIEEDFLKKHYQQLKLRDKNINLLNSVEEEQEILKKKMQNSSKQDWKKDTSDNPKGILQMVEHFRKKYAKKYYSSQQQQRKKNGQQSTSSSQSEKGQYFSPIILKSSQTPQQIFTNNSSGQDRGKKVSLCRGQKNIFWKYMEGVPQMKKEKEKQERHNSFQVKKQSIFNNSYLQALQKRRSIQ